MIARLRRRFIVIAMCSLTAVLIVMIGITNIANYCEINRDALETLTMLANNGGSFPKNDQNKKAGQNDGGSGKQYGKHGNSSKETPYETRYFSVTLDDSGAVVQVNTGSIAAITTTDAADMAQTLWSKGKTDGYYGSYKYLAVKTDSGTLYVFLDCHKSLNSFQTFLLASVLASAAGILAVFLLVLIFSKRAVKPVAESYEKQKRFVTDAGHEIKTPLAIIDSNAEVLELEQGESKWTKSIRNQVQRLTVLTESLISLARMEESADKLVMVDFSLSDAVQESAEPFDALAAASGRAITADIQSGITFCGNEQLIRQLVGILLDNAIKYCTEGGSIRLSLKKQGKAIVLTCINPADGLDEGDTDVWFDRFYRADESRSGKPRSYGIGLSMAKTITEAHKGKISARSGDGKNVIVTVVF